MQNYKITIAYDGTDFHGWQFQKNAISISDYLEKRFYKVFNQKIKLLGASRTDAGVHALGQVARFQTDLNIPAEKLLQSWNGKLPKSILIRNLEKVSPDFHPHHNVDYKKYYYHIFLKRPLPFVARYGWYYSFIDSVDIQKFEKALNFYIGEHNFASFCKIEDPNKSTIRKIDSISLNKFDKFSTLQVVIQGKSFLRFQIRRMIGYALDVARQKKLSADFIKEILTNPNPQQKLLKAGACGLCLRKIVYKDEKIIR